MYFSIRFIYYFLPEVPCKGLSITFWGSDTFESWDTEDNPDVFIPWTVTGSYKLVGNKAFNKKLFYKHASKRQYLVWDMDKNFWTVNILQFS